VRTAEGREEVVQRDLIGEVDSRQAEADPMLVTAEQIVLTDGSIEEAAGFYS
jgi:hypothetical protein